MAIKSWNLFGETGDMPDLVHCEPIATRSKLHNWELAPHRHARLHQFLVIEKGGGRALIDGEAHQLRSSALVNVPIGCVHAFSFKQGTQGFVLTLAAEALDEMIPLREGLRSLLNQAYAGRSTSAINRLMRDIWREYINLDFARAHVLRAMSAHLAGLVVRHIEAKSLQSDRSAEHSLPRRFETLVEKHFLEHRSVADYARGLRVAPGHLSRVMRLATGFPASRFIEARVVREARRLLAFTDLPVAEIGFELGYDDPAYFTRVFSRATAQSPRAFREKLRKSATTK
jgi:AraC family transcriptional activator of pobA